MKTFQGWIRPPETDAEYIDSIRQSHTREKRDGIRHLLISAGCFGASILAGCLMVWPRDTGFPDLHLYTAVGVCFGVAGGAFGAFFLYSLDAEMTLRSLLSTVGLPIAMLIVALLMVFWVPRLAQQQIEGTLAQSGFDEGVVSGLVSGFLLCAAFQHGIWARKKLTGGCKTERLLLKYYDEQRNTAGSK